MATDQATLEALNREYIRSVSEADVRWFDANLAEDFVNSNPDCSRVDRAGFLAQLDATCELIVATAVEPATAFLADPRVRWLRLPATALVPELWSGGMEVANGQLVACLDDYEFAIDPGLNDKFRRNRLAAPESAAV